MNIYFKNSYYWILNLIQIQFFLSLISLPILIAWGLPFSSLTMLGNILFAPFLTCFLLSSSLVFFTELLQIPNSICIWLLEQVTRFWLWCLTWGSKWWIIGFTYLMLPISFITALIALIILQHPEWGKKDTSAFLYTFLFCLLLIINKMLHGPKQAIVTCNKETVVVENNNGSLILTDKGGLGEKLNPASWIQYTFMSELTKQFGTTTIKNIVINPNKISTLDAAHTLCQETIVEHITFTHPIEKHTKKTKKLIENTVHEGTHITTVYPTKTSYNLLPNNNRKHPQKTMLEVTF